MESLGKVIRYAQRILAEPSAPEAVVEPVATRIQDGTTAPVVTRFGMVVFPGSDRPHGPAWTLLLPVAFWPRCGLVPEKYVPDARRAHDRDTADRLAAAVGPRLVWWPAGVPDDPLLCLVSSRLGRRLEDHVSWFAALRAAVREARERGERLLVVAETATARYAARAAQLLGAGQLMMTMGGCRGCASLESWARWVRRRSTAGVAESACGHAVFQAWMSPNLQECTGPMRSAEDDTRWGFAALPARDRLAFAAADRVLVLAARPGGVIDRLTCDRLNRSEPGRSQLVVADWPGAMPQKLRAAYVERGATTWTPAMAVPFRATFSGSAFQVHRSPRVTFADLPGDYLIHCTRRRNGPWPGQSMDDYLDDLILSRLSSDHSPLAALQRIAAQRRIYGSTRVTRAERPVVSFTAAPASELATLRTFRAHRGGWDFEPYAVAIRRPWLLARGARAVIYGDEHTWDTLAEELRPFFQPACSRTQLGRTMDWTIEREWRYVGDLDLTDVAQEDIVLLVPTEHDARRLQRVTTWPVIVAASGIKPTCGAAPTHHRGASTS